MQVFKPLIHYFVEAPLAAITASVVSISFTHLDVGSLSHSSWHFLSLSELPFSGLSTDVLRGYSLGFGWATESPSLFLKPLHS